MKHLTHGLYLGPRPRILIVDDDEVTVELLRHICLRIEPGIELDDTGSGEVAASLLKHEAIYDLVIMDVQLAERRSGIEVWRDCQAELPGVPFVFISAIGAREFQRKMGKCGELPVFVPKPCSLLTLAHVIGEALHHTKDRAA